MNPRSNKSINTHSINHCTCRQGVFSPHCILHKEVKAKQVKDCGCISGESLNIVCRKHLATYTPSAKPTYKGPRFEYQQITTREFDRVPQLNKLGLEGWEVVGQHAGGAAREGAVIAYMMMREIY